MTRNSTRSEDKETTVLSKRLVLESEKRGSTQRDFAEYLSEDQAQLSRWMKGNPVPGYERWIGIAYRLDIPWVDAVLLHKKAKEEKGQGNSVDYEDELANKSYADYVPEAREATKRGARTRMDIHLPPSNIAGNVAIFSSAEPRSLKILGYANGSRDGRLIMDNTPIEFTICPPKLERIKSAYGVIVSGDSMVDKYRSGTILHVNPEASYRADDGVIIQTIDPATGNTYGYVKIFVSKTDRELVVRQLNPPGELRWPLSEVRAVHRVVGTDEMR